MSYISVLVYFIVVLAVGAEQNTSSISFEAGSDEQGNKNTAIAANISLAGSRQLLFGFGRSKLLSGTEIINNNFSYLGLSKKVSDDWKITGMFEQSGLKNQFTMLSTSVPVRYSQDNYYLEVIPALRGIKFTTLLNKEVAVSSSALGFRAGLYMGKYFRLSANTYSYSYSHDVSKLATFAATRYFNEKTLLLSSGLLKKSYNIESGLDFDSFSISLGKNRSTSAIDYSKSDYIYSVFDIVLSDKLSLSALFGEYLNTPADQNNYSSLTLNYAF